MAIVTSKLVSAAMLQDFIIAKNALPLAAGVITMYEDSNHAILKNWYYQTGVAGAYTYAALPNPMTLSAAGTMVDVNGNDIIPFYYPWNESDSDVPDPYFVTVYDANGQLQFTRSGFPFVPQESSNPGTPNFVTQENYIVNNRFWRNIGTLVPSSSNNSTWTTQYNNTGSVAYWTLAPDQHDGFSMPDFNYIVPTGDLGNATETITFSTFAAALAPVLNNDIQPEYYINHNCSADSGTYTKIYQFPISLHTATLANQPFSVTIQTMGSITLTLSIYAFAGSGVASASPQVIGSFMLSTAGWTKTTFNGIFPTNLGLPTSSTKDDAYYLQISFSSGAAIFNFTIPSIYIYDNSQAIVDGKQLFSFSTYDQIDSVVSSPRTGDLRISLNTFSPFGWVPVNGGVIGMSTSTGTPGIARANVDTWPLYNLIWNSFAAFSKGNSTASGTNAIAQMYTSTGTAVGYGPNVTTPTTAVVDFSANKQLALTALMGQVIMGTVPVSSLLGNYVQTVSLASNSGGFLLLQTTNNLNLFSGCPFTIFNTTGQYPGSPALTPNTIYYMMLVGPNQFYVAASLSNCLTQTPIGFAGLGMGTTTVTLLPLGVTTGEYDHTSALANTLPTTITPTIASGGGTTTQINMKSAVQASVMMNMFMKL